ncbi:phosphatase PAP2 family protein [Schumannella sp. 10F1B-5-1]|uniref:phosphatase PAP2 family protein n=1 Tax=Schumannella sp. 10F1B-5-1 TaxID=2590780 RepID=UPI0011314C88|nr:phosphatase PAP2 family protein [Schumannella sp. 10F1B-5-1]TPW73631.1 phosphatase PAP2 family protein [Schumannella sp. 10F1B-5-1]
MPEIRRSPVTARRVRAAVVALAAAGGLAGVFALAVLTTRGQHVEQGVLDLAAYSESSPLLALVSIPALLGACAVVALVALVQRRVIGAIVGVGVIGVANVLGQALKHLLLDRPNLAVDASNSFPSGHAVAVASVLFALLLVSPALVRLVLAPVSAVLLGAVSIQLVHLGWHRPSDVLGGVLLAASLTAIGALVPHAAPPVAPGLPRRLTRRLGGALALLGGVAAIVATAGGTVRALDISHSAIVTGAFAYGLVAAAVLLAPAALLWAMPVTRPAATAGTGAGASDGSARGRASTPLGDPIAGTSISGSPSRDRALSRVA